MNFNIYVDTFLDIKKFSKYENDFVFVGNRVYVNLPNGNRVKLYLDSKYSNRKDSVTAVAINKLDGEIDNTQIPFSNYFREVQCSANAPKWYPHIEDGEWYFSQYEWCLPNNDDFKALAEGIDKYIALWE